METSGRTVSIYINGIQLSAPEGASLASVLLANRIPARSSVNGEPRTALCGMGICMECRAKVNGILHVRTCQLTVRAGMQVTTQ